MLALARARRYDQGDAGGVFYGSWMQRTGDLSRQTVVIAEESTMKSATRIAKVLIVDDEPDTVDVVSRMLEGNGFEVARAYDGDQALELAYRLKPALVLLDVMMPEQDGWLVCAKLKSVEPAPKIVIFTVLKHGEADRFSEFVHADGILHKPFTREQLLATVNRVLGNDNERPATAG